MAQIKIDNLSVTGSDLFSDSESYLDQLSNDSDNSSIKGGDGPRTCPCIEFGLNMMV